jgi:hypothetical protein
MRLHKYFALILIVFSFIIGSCASYSKVYPEPEIVQSVIEPGDKVKIVTDDNEETTFVVVEVTDESIVGESETVLFTDIKRLKKQTRSAGWNFLFTTIGAISGGATGWPID